ncbi:hypothetical protein YUYDRAFT_02077 [Streptomyces sp. ScaeMP-e48]|uniref:hypothetical protein n=1 Tax=Streptomyces sp. ScaeMP-e48 TaxID=1100823 RepID=UPI0008239F40|nr:hypothetical protein [Streptomyces sp. ScaeMP-e48]SCK20062.1 hypothetical protein YUYDRAFT_02077 [Streptomyces sp. ScaeMP-e48]
MGYRHKQKRIEIRFEEPSPFAGFEATLRGKTLGEFLNLQGIGEVDKSSLFEQLREMSQSLLTWNLEDENGDPVPVSPEAVFEQDQDLMIALATAWMQGLAGVSAPLEPSSTDGQPSLEANIPMEPLSESLAS